MSTAPRTAARNGGGDPELPQHAERGLKFLQGVERTCRLGQQAAVSRPFYEPIPHREARTGFRDGG